MRSVVFYSFQFLGQGDPDGLLESIAEQRNANRSAGEVAVRSSYVLYAFSIRVSKNDNLQYLIRKFIDMIHRIC